MLLLFLDTVRRKPHTAARSLHGKLGASSQTGPTHGFHQCGIKPTGLDSVSPYISSLALHTLETLICLYMGLLLVELTLT